MDHPSRASDLDQIYKFVPIEVLAKADGNISMIDSMVNDIKEAIKMKIDPIPVDGGRGGTYSFRNSKEKIVAIVKPVDEVAYAPNNPNGYVGKKLGQFDQDRSVRVGECGFREVAAYLLDHDGFANVPPTTLVKITHPKFNINVDGASLTDPLKKKVTKVASLQQYVHHDYDASDCGTSNFPIDAVHRIGILDIRIFNTDRHGGNLLVRKLNDPARPNKVELIPIDHGLCLPETLEDPYLEWIYWPQASVPFSMEELEYIEQLDPVRECKMLRSKLPMVRKVCLRMLYLSTVFLKEAAASGLVLSQIGKMMTRNGEGNPSELELVCMEARKWVERMKSSTADIGMEEVEPDYYPPLKSALWNILFRAACVCGGQNQHLEGQGDLEDGDLSVYSVFQPLDTSLSNFFMSLKKMALGDEETTNCGTKSDSEDDCRTNPFWEDESDGQEKPGRVIFVKLADMNDKEWELFMKKFKELLYPVLAKLKSII
ncbi:hypothetical protein SAY87_016020 [Trapa incisa]|uniref:1-phosphatidylinositol 4-kinase n=1 Tax=Trapa incisa TaxID=236973 RepID=A0AAN7QU30_9MYRT|nr:hypothetical protein SAY87_016020 [Trapa incisa]